VPNCEANTTLTSTASKHRPGNQRQSSRDENGRVIQVPPRYRTTRILVHPPAMQQGHKIHALTRVPAT